MNVKYCSIFVCDVFIFLSKVGRYLGRYRYVEATQVMPATITIISRRYTTLDDFPKDQVFSNIYVISI